MKIYQAKNIEEKEIRLTCINSAKKPIENNNMLRFIIKDADSEPDSNKIKHQMISMKFLLCFKYKS